MSTQLEKCQQQAKHLPLQERAQLIKSLIAGLDDLDERNLESLWLQEASRRLQAYKAGNIESKPSDDVFFNARTKLKEM